MRFSRTGMTKLWLIEPLAQRDDRGFFARTFCEQEYTARGLETRFVQHSISYSRLRGTVRGLHFQRLPHAETKVVTCYKGTIWDVIVDLRHNSVTYGQWTSFILSGENRRSLYIPKGCAHGFQTLSDHVEVSYLISEFYAPDAAAGLRYDDPALGIDWPLAPTMISKKDQDWPIFIPEKPPVIDNDISASG